MNIDWSKSVLTVVTSPSMRLAQEELDGLIAAWSGPSRRHTDPEDLGSMVMGLDTPSLFAEPALEVISATPEWVNKHGDLLAPLLGRPQVAGALLLLVPSLDRRRGFGKAVAAADALYQVDVPTRPQDVQSWLIGRIHGLDVQVKGPFDIAQALIKMRGTSCDALLAALDQAVDTVDDEALTADHILAIMGGDSEEPVYMITDAFMKGNVSAALRQIHAGNGYAPEMVLTALSNEVRKMQASLATSDDKEANSWLGPRSRAKLGFARKRAQSLGSRNLERLQDGLVQAQRQCRSNQDSHLALELFMIHAQRVIRPAGR